MSLRVIVGGFQAVLGLTPKSKEHTHTHMQILTAQKLHRFLLLAFLVTFCFIYIIHLLLSPFEKKAFLPWSWWSSSLNVSKVLKSGCTQVVFVGNKLCPEPSFTYGEGEMCTNILLIWMLTETFIQISYNCVWVGWKVVWYDCCLC